MQTDIFAKEPQLDTVEPSSFASEHRCPLEMKPGSSLCYCVASPWAEPNKRRMQRLRKLIKQNFTQADYDSYLLHLLPWADRICTCPHGNYMIQEVMGRASTTTLQIFISSCSITDIIVNEFGSRVIENLTEMHNGLLVPLMFSRISRVFNRLARNPRANYAVQKLCGMMPFEKFGVILRAVLPHASRLSVDPHGAYVVQVILNRLSAAAAYGYLYDDGQEATKKIDSNVLVYSMFEKMLNDLVAAGPTMIQHQTGNFTVQAMVGVLGWCPSAEERFINGVCEHMVMYVACKFGTRVVEAVVEYGSPWAKDRILNRLLQLNDDEFSFFLRTHFSSYLYPKVLASANELQITALQEKTNRALADSANPYAVGLLIEDSMPASTSPPTLEKEAFGSQSCASSTSSGSSAPIASSLSADAPEFIYYG